MKKKDYNTMTTILICTVGGSHQPIVTALNEIKPNFVLFICTDKDPATGRAGSRTQIEDPGNCIKAYPKDEKPSLPNIPAQTGLTSEQYRVCNTVSDDLDQIYTDCLVAIDKIVHEFPDAKIIADYSGGTKSMSAGLVMAGLEREGIDLQLVMGSRGDLVKVQDGSQYTAAANSQQIRFQRQIAPYQQAWTRYAYGEAEAGLNKIKAPRENSLRGRYTRFRDISRAFAAWDNFDHKTALDILKQYAPNLPEAFKEYLSCAVRLNDNKPEKRDAACLYDLYLNAQRRAAQGRYDDAIARVYRLIEWTAQWLLETQCGIKTGDIKADQLPESMPLKPNRNGIIQAGLFDAWRLVKHKTNGAAARFISGQEESLLNHLKIRNGSILAHGFFPIQKKDWQPIQIWLEVEFIPMLMSETTHVGIKQIPAQLPNQYCL